MYKVMVFLFFLLLHGCGLNSLFVADEVNKVTIVKSTPYMKHYRAYFTRTDLKMMQNDKKYLFLYHDKENELGILLHRKDQYILYNLSNPKKQALALNATPKTEYTHVLRKFKDKGYRTIDSPKAVGYTASVSLTRYKGVKTLLFEVKDYSRLHALYKHAIATYDATKIKNIKTRLPRSLIYDEYMYYEKLATKPAQIAQLQIIAKKLKLETASVKKYAPYAYYLHESSLDELSNYLSQKSIKNTLSSLQYSMLKQRRSDLEEEKLLTKGSLEDLIAAYKINSNPKYKERIMTLMKESQENP